MIVIIAVIILGFRIALISGALDDPVNFTLCPNCKNKAKRLSKGWQRCENCSFQFEVDRKGNSIKYSKTGYYINALLGIVFTILTLLLIWESYNEFVKTGAHDLRNFSGIALTFYFSFMCVREFPRSLKGYKFYKEQREELS